VLADPFRNVGKYLAEFGASLHKRRQASTASSYTIGNVYV